MGIDALTDDERPPYRSATSATYHQGPADIDLMARSLTPLPANVLAALSGAGAAVVGVLMVTRAPANVMLVIYFAALLRTALNPYLARRQFATKHFRQLTNGAAGLSIRLALTPDHLQVDAGWTSSVYRWDSFSSYHRTRLHLVLCRGDQPLLMFPLDQIPTETIADVERRLDEVGTPLQRPKTNGVRVAINVLIIAGLVLLAFLSESATLIIG